MAVVRRRKTATELTQLSCCLTVGLVVAAACGPNDRSESRIAELAAIEARWEQEGLDAAKAGWRPVALPHSYTGLVDSMALTDSSGVYGDPIDLLPYREPLGETADSGFTLDVMLLTPVVRVGESPLLVVSIQTDDTPVRFEDDIGFTYSIFNQSGEAPDILYVEGGGGHQLYKVDG